MQKSVRHTKPLLKAIAWIGIPWDLWAARFIVVTMKQQTSTSGREPAETTSRERKEHRLLIEPGDTLSQALDRHFPHRSWRLWGKNGMIAKIAAANPGVRDINLIYPGMVLNLGPLGDGWEVVVATKAPTPFSRVPAAESPPADVKTEDSTEPIRRYGWLSISPTFSYTRIDSTDLNTGASATFLSDLSPGFSFAWGQHWSDHFESFLEIGFQQVHFNAPSSSITLDSSSHVLTDIGIGGRIHPWENEPLSVDVGVRMQQAPYVHGTSTTEDSVDAVTIPTLSAGLEYRFADLWPFSVSAYAHYDEFLPVTASGYSVKAGSGYDAGARVSESLSRSIDLSGDAWYSYASQNSTIATELRKDVEVTFGFTFRFSPPESPQSSREKTQ